MVADYHHKSGSKPAVSPDPLFIIFHLPPQKYTVLLQEHKKLHQQHWIIAIIRIHIYRSTCFLHVFPGFTRNKKRNSLLKATSPWLLRSAGRPVARRSGIRVSRRAPRPPAARSDWAGRYGNEWDHEFLVEKLRLMKMNVTECWLLIS